MHATQISVPEIESWKNPFIMLMSFKGSTWQLDSHEKYYQVKTLSSYKFKHVTSITKT